jgi:hypothetical protein
MSETQVHHIQAQLEPADGSFPGQVTEGYYVVDDGILTMTDAGGGAVEIDGRRFTVTLGPDTNARAIAARLTKQIRLALNPKTDFNRRVRMPDLGLA